jgi:hypothetical protein
MKTSGSNFDLIMQELLKQKQILEDLEAENQELRRQLADLREGRGIFVEIVGERFALQKETSASSSSEVEVPSTPQPQSVPTLDEAPTTMINALSSVTPIPEGVPANLDEKAEEDTLSLTPAFMEDMQLDEFTSASTNPMAVWTNSAPKPTPTNEDEKVSLRRELMGSFLLD